MSCASREILFSKVKAKKKIALSMCYRTLLLIGVANKICYSLNCVCVYNEVILILQRRLLLTVVKSCLLAHRH